MNALAQNLADQEQARVLAESIISKRLGLEWDNLAVRLRDQVIHELEMEACVIEEGIERGKVMERKVFISSLYFLTLLEKRIDKSLSKALYEILITHEIMGSDEIIEYLSMPEVKMMSAEALVGVLILAITRLNESVVNELIKYAPMAKDYYVYSLECYLPNIYSQSYNVKVRRIAEILEEWRERILVAQRGLYPHSIYEEGAGRI